MVFLQLGFEGWKTMGVQKRSCGESYASPHRAGLVARAAKFPCQVLNKQNVADQGYILDHLTVTLAM
jgi:hypothetical protein